MIDRRKVMTGLAFGALAPLPMRALAAQRVPFGWADAWPQTDFSRAAVDFAEIVSGGPPKDGVPSIDAPRFVAMEEARRTVLEREAVMSVEHDGVARAYPLAIPIWREIVIPLLLQNPKVLMGNDAEDV